MVCTNFSPLLLRRVSFFEALPSSPPTSLSRCVSLAPSRTFPLPLHFCCPHDSGSEADTTQALSYLCLSPKQPWAPRQWYVAGHAQQTQGLGVIWESLRKHCCTEACQAQTNEKVDSSYIKLYCVKIGAHKKPNVKLLIWAELCSCVVK